MGAYSVVEYATWSYAQGQFSLHTPFVCHARHIGFELSRMEDGRGGIVPALTLSRTVFALSAFVLYEPKRASLNFSLVTREEAPVVVAAAGGGWLARLGNVTLLMVEPVVVEVAPRLGRDPPDGDPLVCTPRSARKL